MAVRYIETTAASGARNLAWVPLDVNAPRTTIVVGVNKTGNGTFAADVQYTLDNILEANVSVVPFVERTINVSATAFGIDHPAAAIRLAITSASGHNNISFRLIQTGP